MNRELNLNNYPFNFNVDLIDKEVNFFLYKGNYQEALRILEEVEYVWFKAKIEGRVPSGTGYEHLEEYAIKSLMGKASKLKSGKSSEKVEDFFATWVDKKIKQVKKKIESENEKQIENILIKEEKYTGSTRYLVLDEFFELKKEFKDLSQNRIIKLLSIILEKDSRTTKGYKNGEKKYVKAESTNKATELINKVKKGDYL